MPVRCRGVDVHQRSVVAGALITAADGTVRREVRPFGAMGAMTGDLVGLHDGLNGLGLGLLGLGLGLGQVALESTGVYWRPV